VAELKTKPTGAAVDAFLDNIADPAKRADAHALRVLMARVSGAPAEMWGPSIVGFGTYRYKYESGREGEMCRIGFAPRAQEFALYNLGVARQEALLARLGKHKTGKGCLYLKRLADVDEAVLEQLIAGGLAHMNETYPEG
jgi:Domain of unknown function (DU1801)